MAGAITDVPGVRVGHAQRTTRGWRTGTTVVYVPAGATAGVDVRGGGPGTRETDALHATTLVDRLHAICLTGGSAFGLAAADGVMGWLEQRGLGVKVGPEPAHVVPVVPAAVIFDLGRGGDFSKRPDASFGERAIAGARASTTRGSVGAGTGAVAGGLQGGVGTASTMVDDVVVGALAVVNAAGSLVDPATGLPWHPLGARRRRPDAAVRRALDEVMAARIPPPLNTTIGVIATTAMLTKAEAGKLASVGHDGMARAIRPVHSMFDGDTVFALATGHDPLPEPGARFRDPASRPGVFSRILAAGAACFADACTDALLSATGVGGPPSYREVCEGRTGTT